MKKGLILVLAVAMALCIGIGGTLAYLFVSTGPVTNTFSYGDINITLWENDYILASNTLDTKKIVTSESDYKMVPGNTMPKNPTVTVEANSEACWLFVKIEEANNFANFMSYTVASDWTQGDGTDIPDNVYYRAVAATTADTDYEVLAGNQVTVKTAVTKAQLNALTDTTLPKLTFTAYAVQSANVADAATAWGIANNTTT